MHDKIQEMIILVGLGNPGKTYEKSRHNVGFLVIDRLAKKAFRKSKSGLLTYSWYSGNIELVKPQTFMNESGKAVAYTMARHGVNLDNLYVVHDDLDLQLGSFKIQKGKGPKEHNGLLSIYKQLGSKNFWHIRVGIDNRNTDIPGETYVLQAFSKGEQEKLENVIDELVKKITDEVLAL